MRSVSQRGEDSEEEPATYENVQNPESEESKGIATLWESAPSEITVLSDTINPF